jgi:pentatricopeptide repeat protein
LDKAALKAEETLDEMRGSYIGGNIRMRPNSYCYNCVMDVWARQGKPSNAEAIFLKMCNDVDQGNPAAKPTTASFNSRFLFRCICFVCNFITKALFSSSQGVFVFS